MRLLPTVNRSAQTPSGIGEVPPEFGPPFPEGFPLHFGGAAVIGFAPFPALRDLLHALLRGVQ
jgi:hypothetical protein